MKNKAKIIISSGCILTKIENSTGSRQVNCWKERGLDGIQLYQDVHHKYISRELIIQRYSLAHNGVYFFFRRGGTFGSQTRSNYKFGIYCFGSLKITRCMSDNNALHVVACQFGTRLNPAERYKVIVKTYVALLHQKWEPRHKGKPALITITKKVDGRIQ